MTVLVADTHVHVQRLVSVVKLATILEYAIEEQHSVVHFLWAKALNAKDIHKEKFPVYDGQCLLHKAVQTESRNSLKDPRKSQMMPGQVTLLRLQQK
jgi:hypothetical protein